MAESNLREWRCPSCAHILDLQLLAPGSVVEIKCRSCNSYSTAIGTLAGTILLPSRLSDILEPTA